MRILPAQRERLAAFLSGRGVELGPGHQPFDVPLGLEVRFVDRWLADENARLFPEVPERPFVQPDVMANFDTDRLGPLRDKSQDFVICSHVLEHLAEPIGFIAEIYRVLRPGGLALITLPDRRCTFDRNRSPTTLDHLLGEYRAGVTEVDDDHIADFLETTSPHIAPSIDRDLVSEAERAAVLEHHRLRSVHVHCWADDEFLPILLFGIEHLDQRWMLMDRIHPEGEGFEFGFVLKRRSEWRPAGRLARQFEEAWDRF